LTIFKIVVIAASYIFIVNKIINYKELNNVWLQIKGFDFIKILLLLLTLILMIVNWNIEALKWKLLVKKLENISFIRAVRAVFTGITMAIFTPNRIGELGGRILLLSSKNRKSGILATAIGSFSQVIITIFTGLVSFCLFIVYYPEKSFFQNIPNIFILVFTLILISAVLYFYFNLSLFTGWFEKTRFIKKYRDNFLFINQYENNILLKALLYSMIRYFVFLTQYLILLKLTGVEINLVEGIISVGIMYFFMLFIPIITFAEPGIRGSVAILVFGIFSGEVVGIISASILLWIINLAIPAIMGSFVLSRTKI
jgi:hypothetical protein